MSACWDRMYSIYFYLTIALLSINLGGVLFLTLKWVPDAGIARVTGLLVFGFTLFFVEHFIGLGSLSWLWPITTLISGTIIWRERAQWDKAAVRADMWVFMLALLFALIWRWRYPNIDGGTEHLTDLLFIVNYLPGSRLPAADHWLPGYAFDFYYGWQHYAAALMGRIFSMPPGTTMNMASAVLFALTASLGWSVASRFIDKTWPKVLLVLALMLGGNGLSPILPLLIKAPTAAEAVTASAVQNRFWAMVRFSGMSDEQVNTAIGKPLARAKDQQRLDLPQETISFYNFLGDYHPPLGGYAMMLYGLGLIGMLVRRAKPELDAEGAEIVVPKWQEPLLIGLLSTSAVLLLAINAWVFPLQVFLVIAAYYWLYDKGRLNVAALLIGGAAALLLIFPYFTYFAPAALPSPIKWVKAGAHTDVAVFIAIHWPILVLLLCGFVMARRARWSLYLTIFLSAVLLASELFYVDDQLGDLYDRFNTTIKWWSWLLPATLIGVGSMAWSYGGKAIRAVVSFVAVAILVVPLVDSVIWLANAPKEIRGKFAGDAWLRQEPAHRSMLDYLKTAPKGILLEDPEGGAYNNSSAFALFTQNVSAIGWPGHEYQWRGNAGFVNDRAELARHFYRGELPESSAWLLKNQVRYVIWASWNDDKTPGAWAKINAEIDGEYIWQGYRELESQRWGMWVKR